MPVCPACKQEQTKRIQGRCPGCNTKVEPYKGHWVRSGQYSPPEEIIRNFEQNLSKRLSVGREVKVTFSIPRKGLRITRERAAAEQLLKVAEYDIDLVIQSIDYLFDDPVMGRKLRNTLIFIQDDFLVAMAVIRAKREYDRLVEEKNRSRVEEYLKDSLF